MEIIEEIKPECICCICLQEKRKLFEIFDPVYMRDNFTIAQMLGTYAHYRIDIHGQLPHKMCKVCMMEVYRVHDFMRKTSNAYNQLLEIFAVDQGIYNDKGTQTEIFSIHPCEVCDEKYFDIYDLRAHRLKRHGRGVKKCRLCSQTFPDMRNLKSHLIKLHPNSGLTFELQCPWCNKSFSRKYQMKRHIIKMHQKNTVERTNYTVRTEVHLENNACDNAVVCNDFDVDNLHIKAAEATCELIACENIIVEVDKQNTAINACEIVKDLEINVLKEVSDPDLQMNMVPENPEEDNHDDANNSFTECVFEEYLDDFQNDTDETETISTEFINEVPITIQTIDETSPKLQNTKIISEHLTKKHVRKPNKTKTLNLEQSTAEKESDDDINYKCNFCDKKFPNQNYVHKHELLHTNLVHEHMRSHSNDRNFICSHCGASFKRKDYLIVHIRRHTGERPFKCKYCERTFIRVTDVRMHERYHTDERSHVCKICDKGFHKRGNLLVHMRSHTGERPYKCDQCNKSYAQLNDLKNHKRRHAGIRYACPHCDMSFCKMYTLRNHALRVHGLQIEISRKHIAKFKTN